MVFFIYRKWKTLRQKGMPNLNLRHICKRLFTFFDPFWTHLASIKRKLFYLFQKANFGKSNKSEKTSCFIHIFVNNFCGWLCCEFNNGLAMSIKFFMFYTTCRIQNFGLVPHFGIFKAGIYEQLQLLSPWHICLTPRTLSEHVLYCTCSMYT